MARRRPYYTELFAYLALRPRGATVDEIAEDLHLTPARVRTDMKILRDWLGTDPRTGQLFLPDARTTPGALQRGIATYQLDGVLCDWHLFERLEAAATTAVDPDLRVAALEAAMDLVTGPPFARARPAGWGWLFEGDRVDLHAMKAVGDTAVKLIDYHHGRNDHQAAEDVLKTLTAIDPALAQELLSGAAS